MKDERKLNMQDLPLADRPYEKMESCGSSTLTEAELLSVILCSGTRHISALDIARHLLGSGGSLKELSELSLEELQEFDGIGRVKALRLRALFELSRRLCYGIDSGKKAARPLIRGASDAIDIMAPQLGDLPREEFHILMLDVRGRLIRTARISGGGLANAAVYPRDIFREAVKANAASLILCHNHPSGDPSPSRDDLETSEELIKLGRLMGIKVLDHIIVSQRNSLSLRERGYLD